MSMYQSSYYHHHPLISPPNYDSYLSSLNPPFSSDIICPGLPYPPMERSTSTTISLHHHVDHQNLEDHGLLGMQQHGKLGTMRKVLSTGDIQAFPPQILKNSANGSFYQMTSFGDNNHNGNQKLIDGLDSTGGRVGRYSAEERRERIERYRTKRRQRNFQKKITYSCRKTLADRRPRVHGRFARSEELDMDNVNNERRSQSEEVALALPVLVAGDDDYHCYDGELWTNFADDFSMNSFIY